MASIALLSAGVVAAFACSKTVDDPEDINVGALEGEELARAALKIMGAPQVPRADGEQASCSATGCHSINRITLRQWKEQLDIATTFFADTTKTQEERINFARQNPGNADTEFTPERIGMMSAGVHLGLGAQVSEERTPLAYAQGKMFADVFADKPELYAEFRQKMLMPVLPDYPRLTPTKYEIVLKWFRDGMPKMEEIILENERPTSCTDSFDGLKAHASAVKGDNWSSRNKARSMPNFGCAPGAKSTDCFLQKREGADIFPSAEAAEFSKGWGLEGSTVRVMRDFSAPNSYWVRTSADGRFIATGGGRGSGAQAMDLEATLRGERRDIGLSASYDPDFFPDNAGFMFQGGTKYCSQSLLENPATTLVSFSEPECSSLSKASGLYQTIGQVMSDNSLSDRFILYSIWAGDSGAYTAQARDTVARAGGDSKINVFTAVADGTDGKYTVPGPPRIFDMPYLGDTMMGRSGRIIGSRIAGVSGTLGYQIDTLIDYKADGSHAFRDKPSAIGTICMKGNKANLSFDERFLATHHYNEPGDYEPTDPQIAGFTEKGSADVIVVDFVTGRKVKVAKMNPGQFALYAHFRSDGWLYFLVVDHNTNTFYAVASDWAVRQLDSAPTP